MLRNTFPLILAIFLLLAACSDTDGALQGGGWGNGGGYGHIKFGVPF